MDESTSHQFAPDMSTVLWLAYLTVDPAPLLPGPHRRLLDIWTDLAATATLGTGHARPAIAGPLVERSSPAPGPGTPPL